MRDRQRRLSPYRERALLRQIQPREAPVEPRRGEPMPVHRVATGVDLLAMDHVALSAADPDAMAAFLCDHLGMHELAREPGTTVVGAEDRAAAVSVTAADEPREPGALARLVLRVADVERAIAALPAGTGVEGDRIERADFPNPEGLGLGFTLVAGGGIDYDLDHVRLRVCDPDQTRAAFAEVGFVPRGQALHVADKYIQLAGAPGCTDRPLLRHIGLRVDSIEAVAARARDGGQELDERAAQQDTFATVLPGPERIGLLFVRQPPPA